MFCQTIWRLHGKRSHQARSIKDQSGALLSNEKDIFHRLREVFKDLLNPVSITPPDAQEVHLGGIPSLCSRSPPRCQNTESWKCCSSHLMSTVRKHRSSHSEQNLEVLQKYGVDDRLLLAVKSLYSCSDVCVRVRRVKSQLFTVGVGPRKWCVMSPLLFISYMS